MRVKKHQQKKTELIREKKPKIQLKKKNFKKIKIDRIEKIPD